MTDQVNTSTVQPRLKWLRLSATPKKIVACGLILLLTGGQLLRVIDFVSVYGGLEHDGGWSLSVSRSLVEDGSYTATVATIVRPDVIAADNIDGKFDLQTPTGRILFRASSPIGPASNIPNALPLLLFGTGYWPLRAGPLIFYALLLLLGAALVYQLAGLWAVLLFHAFIFFYPHLSIFLSYQALGEVPSLVYILAAYLLFGVALGRSKHRWRWFFATGLLAGLAVNAKMVALWSIGGIFVWAAGLWLVDRWWTRRDEADATSPLRLPGLLLLGSGFLSIPLLWEVVQWWGITRLADFETYIHYMTTRFGDLLDAGSGVRERTHSGPGFMWDKFLRLQEISHPQPGVTILIFVAIFAGGLMLLWRWRTQRQPQALLGVIWLGWLINTAWFVGVAKTGWPRHFWFGLMLAVLLLCVVTVSLLSTYQSRTASGASDYWPIVSGLILLLLIGWGFLSQPHVRSLSLGETLVTHWQQKQVHDPYKAYLPWIIIPRDSQAEVIDYLTALPPQANVYYPGQHKAAELSAATGKIFYPLARRVLMPTHPRDVAVIGPSLIAPWMEPGRRAVLREMVGEECPAPILENEYYMICPFPPDPDE